MAWNKPSTENQQSIKKNTAKAPSAKRGVIAGVVIVGALGALCLYLFSNGEATSSALQKKERGRIKEVTPAPAPKTAAEPAQPEKKRKGKRYWENPTTNGLSECQLLKWRNVRMPPPSYTNNAMHLRPKEKYEIFDTYVENEIAMFMTMEPGDGLVGSPNYDEHSKKEFLKSCETPIIIDEKDDEYTKSLKQQMIQTKIELRQRMADGEDFCQIMADTRNEMMRLGQVKQQIEGEMHDMLKSASTREDIETSIAAANKLLEEKGIAPIKVSPIFIRRLMHRKGIK